MANSFRPWRDIGVPRWPRHRCVPPRRCGRGSTPARARESPGACSGGQRSLRSAVVWRRSVQARPVQKRPRAQFCNVDLVTRGKMNPPETDLSSQRESDHDPERVASAREIARAVEGIHQNPDGPVATHQADDRRVCVRGLFGYNAGRRHQRKQPFGQLRLGAPVHVGHDVFFVADRWACDGPRRRAASGTSASPHRARPARSAASPRRHRHRGSP